MGWSSKPKTPGATEEEKALAEVAARDWNDYRTKFVPVENDFLKRTAASRGDLGSVRRTAAADVQQSTAGIGEASLAKGLARGQTASSSRSKLHLADQKLATGATRGKAVSGADNARRDSALRAKLKMSAFGRGLADTTRVATTSAGQRGTEASIQSLGRKLENQEMLLDTAGSVSGMYAKSQGWEI